MVAQSDPSFLVAEVEAVTLDSGVQAVAHISISAVLAATRVTILDRLSQAAFPMDVGSGVLAILITSPGAILAARAPDVILFQAKAQDEPSLASLPVK
jgi:hypothetical protein